MRSYGCEPVERVVASNREAPTLTGKLNKRPDHNVAKKTPSGSSFQAGAVPSSVGFTHGYRWIAPSGHRHYSFPATEWKPGEQNRI